MAILPRPPPDGDAARWHHPDTGPAGGGVGPEQRRTRPARFSPQGGEGRGDRGRKLRSRPHQTHPDHRRYGAGPTGAVDTVAPKRVQSTAHLPQGVFSTDGPDAPAAPVRRSRDPRGRPPHAREPAPACRGIPSWQARVCRTRAYRPYYRLPVGVWGQAEIAPQGATDVEPPRTLAGNGEGLCCVSDRRHEAQAAVPSSAQGKGSTYDH